MFINGEPEETVGDVRGSEAAAEAGGFKERLDPFPILFYEPVSYLAGIVLATARAQSMKTCATGLNVRFFSLTMATGLG